MELAATLKRGRGVGASMQLESLDHVALFVRDAARSAAWYRDVLGLRRVHEDAWGDRPIVMVAGGSGVALFEERETPRPRVRAPGMFAHAAFRTNGAGLALAKEELARKGVPFEEQDHGIARSIYVRDPDGHEIEVTTYDA